MSLLTLLQPSSGGGGGSNRPAIIINQDTNFVGISLYRITSQNGVITGTLDNRVFGGISNINLGTANYPAPTFGTIGAPTGTSASAGLSEDVAITVPFTNIPQDGIVQRIVWLYRTSGASPWVPWAETTIPGLPSPAASQTISFTYQGLVNGGTYDFGAAYLDLQGNAGTAGVLVSGFSVDPSSVAGLQNKNLLSNGNFTQNGNGVSALSFGWKAFNTPGSEGVVAQYTVNGFTYPSEYFTAAAGTSAGVYQTVNVKPGRTYSYCALGRVNGTTTVLNYSRVFIGSTSFAGYNQAAFGNQDPEPIGPKGTFYTPPGVNRIGGYNSTVAGTWQYFSGTFTVPNNVSQIVFMLQGAASASGSCGFYWQGAMLWEGTKYQDYVDGENPLGLQTTSTFLNPQGSITNIGGVPTTLPYTATTTQITLNLPAATITFADQSQVTVPAANPAFSGLASGTTFYVLVGINTITNVYVSFLATTAFSGTQIIQKIGGDGVAPIYTNATVATTSSGSGGGVGGGSGIKGCPAAWQLVETQEHGFVRADALDIGNHIRTQNGWARINEIVMRTAPLYKYTLETKLGHESFDVNDDHKVMLTGGTWVRVADLKEGLELAGGAIVTAVKSLGEGQYIALDVDGHEFMLGSSVCHNGLSY